MDERVFKAKQEQNIKYQRVQARLDSHMLWAKQPLQVQVVCPSVCTASFFPAIVVGEDFQSNNRNLWLILPSVGGGMGGGRGGGRRAGHTCSQSNDWWKLVPDRGGNIDASLTGRRSFIRVFHTPSTWSESREEAEGNNQWLSHKWDAFQRKGKGENRSREHWIVVLREYWIKHWKRYGEDAVVPIVLVDPTTSAHK